MKIIELSGTPYERGLLHGRMYKHEIHELVDRFCVPEWYTDINAISQKDKLLKLTEIYAPDLVEEMIGISEGSDLEAEKIFFLNLLVAASALDDDATKLFMCSQIGFANSDIGPIIGKNNDDPIETEQFYLLQKVKCKDIKYAFLSWVGTLWTNMGINSEGLCIAQTSGSMEKFQETDGIISSLIMKPVLEKCGGAKEAIEYLSKIKCFGIGYTAGITDITGNLYLVEHTYDRFNWHKTEGNYNFSTNHFEYIKGDSIMPAPIAGIEKNSLDRYITLSNYFNTRDSNIPYTLDEMKSILSIHSEFGGLCQHGAANGALNTHCSIILSAELKCMYISNGYPCSRAYNTTSV